jgi:hypothetical protein
MAQHAVFDFDLLFGPAYRHSLAACTTGMLVLALIYGRDVRLAYDQNRRQRTMERAAHVIG